MREIFGRAEYLREICSTDTYARDTGTRCMNLPSAKIVKKGAGELRHKATVKLFESGEYTLSAYLKTTGLTVTSGYKGAFLRVTANGTVYESRPALSSTADRGIGTFASGWERLSVCFPFEYGEDTSVAIELVVTRSRARCTGAVRRWKAGEWRTRSISLLMATSA